MYIFIEINDKMKFVDIIDESCDMFSLFSFFNIESYLKWIAYLNVIFYHFDASNICFSLNSERLTESWKESDHPDIVAAACMSVWFRCDPYLPIGGAEIMWPMRKKWEETRTITKPNIENVAATGNRRTTAELYRH